MKVAVIKYNAGNIQSVEYALQRIGVEALITSDPEQIRKAPRVIFPGVGEASTTMSFLKSNELDSLILSLTQPVLGICLGLQLMCASSEEGKVNCLGIFDEKVSWFGKCDNEKEGEKLKIPHMGWNQLENLKGGLFKGISPGAYVYFVHSYFAEIGSNTIATTRYGMNFSSVLHRENFYATQFHPEKSGKVGELILRNFLAI